MNPKHNISSETVKDMILDGLIIRDFYIHGSLKLEGLEEFISPIDIENCIIESFNGSTTSFAKNIKFTKCIFKDCRFTFSYFYKGLIIQECVFENYLDFQAGGHNQNSNAVIIKNNTFKKFVNFFDCYYESDVVITKNDFIEGTNLLGKPFNIGVCFEVLPIINSNTGKLNHDNEGGHSLST